MHETVAFALRHTRACQRRHLVETAKLTSDPDHCGPVSYFGPTQLKWAIWTREDNCHDGKGHIYACRLFVVEPPKKPCIIRKWNPEIERR